MEQSCAPPAAAPESEVGLSGGQLARSKDGRLWGAMRIISWERKVPLQDARDSIMVRSGTSVRLGVSQLTAKPAYAGNGGNPMCLA